MPRLRFAMRALPALLGAVALAPATAHAVVPSDYGEYPNGTVATGDCQRNDEKVDGTVETWTLLRATPDHRHAPKQSIALLPDPLPERPEKFPFTATGQAVVPVGDEVPAGDAGDCRIVIENPMVVRTEGHGMAIDDPGVYWHYQRRGTVHWVWHDYSENAQVPPPEPCGDNDPELPAPADARPPASKGPNGDWYLASFCNHVESRRFFVLGDDGECASMDRSNWPFTPYFNQYDTGQREDLPIARDNKKGGNACGPSSTMMGVLESIRRDFPGDTPAHQEQFLDKVDALGSLGHTFDQVMALTRADQKPLQDNYALGGEIAKFLKSLGYKKAKLVMLGDSQADVLLNNHNKMMAALTKNPVIVSTAFGGAKWGKTGGGHVILLRNLDVQHPNDYVVDDPAGNWFSTRDSGSWPTGHYGKGSCGFGVAYPMDWVEAYTAGRWMVSMGKPEGSRAPLGGLAPRAARSAPTADGDGVSVFGLSADAETAPATFYVQDAQGRREGFVDGVAVDEIPDGYAVEAAEGDGGPDDDTGVTRRVRELAIPDPQPGTTVHVADPDGGTFALDEDAWKGGAVVTRDRVSATVAAGGSATPAAPALDAAIGDAPAPGGEEQAPGGDQPETGDHGGTAGGAGAQAQGGGGGGGGGAQGQGGAAAPAPAKRAGSRATLVRVAAAKAAVKATLRCASAKGCRVTLRLAARKGRRSVTVGTATTTVTGQRTVTVRLSAAGRRLLRGQRSLAVRLTATQDGTALATARTVSVRAR
ncbi:MAG TPA: hypothetical protein VI318_17405 [Baekduia sp.]